MEKLKLAMGQKVFVVSLAQGFLRKSDYGKLEQVNEPNNIVLALIPFGETIIPIDNGGDKIIKVYDKQGYVIYDAEKPSKNLKGKK